MPRQWPTTSLFQPPSPPSKPLSKITVWEDPEFDPKSPAVYYARVLEIPTPRWTAYEEVRFGVDFGDEVEMTTQERAYTSPIWYTP